MIEIVKRKIALTANGHTKGTVAEHLYTYLFPTGAADVLLHNLTMNISHLLKIQLTRQYYDIGKLGVKLEGFDISDIELCGEMQLLSNLMTIGKHGNIGGNNRTDLCFLRCITNFAHQGEVLTIDNCVHRQVRFHTMFCGDLGNFMQVVDGEMIGRMSTHIERLYTKINRICTCF